MFTVQRRKSSRHVVRLIAIAFTNGSMAVASVYINRLTYATFDAPLQLSDAKPATTLSFRRTAVAIGVPSGVCTSVDIVKRSGK